MSDDLSLAIDVSNQAAALLLSLRARAAEQGWAPADLKADLTTVQTTFTAANTVLKANAYSIEVAATKDAKAIQALDDPAFTKATDNIQAWSTKNCK